MRRRAFIASVGAAALSGLVKQAEAQALPGRTWRLGYLAFAKIPHLVEALQTGLRDLGYVEGRNIAVEYRFANDEPEALERFALELAQLAQDIILTVGTPATAAVKQVTSTIPIVVATAGNLVQTGIVREQIRSTGREYYRDNYLLPRTRPKTPANSKGDILRGDASRRARKCKEHPDAAALGRLARRR